MGQKGGGYRQIPFPRERVSVVDAVELGMKRHSVTAFLEMDVTNLRDAVRRWRRRNNASLSLTAVLLACTGRAIAENPHIHAHHRGSRLTLFDEVDVAVLVEQTIDGRLQPLPLVVRNTESRSPQELHGEIEKAKREVVDRGRLVLGDRKASLMARFGMWFPGPLRRLAWRWILRNPHRLKRIMGTVSFSSLSMFGKVPGWPLAVGVHPLAFTLGNIVRKPVIHEGEVQARDILHLTISFDHDIFDGAPAARFIRRLEQLISSASVLEQQTGTNKAR